jgi:hypothetical protein
MSTYVNPRLQNSTLVDASFFPLLFSDDTVALVLDPGLALIGFEI